MNKNESTDFPTTLRVVEFHKLRNFSGSPGSAIIMMASFSGSQKYGKNREMISMNIFRIDQNCQIWAVCNLKSLRRALI